jgi:hypothetical protein
MGKCITISVSLLVLFALMSEARLRLKALPPTAFEGPTTDSSVEGQHSLGLLHANGLEAVIKWLSDEISGLLKAAKEGDERAQTVLHELAVHLWKTVAMIVAWPFLAAAMVLSRSQPPPPHSPHLLLVQAQLFKPTHSLNTHAAASQRNTKQVCPLLQCAALCHKHTTWRG